MVKMNNKGSTLIESLISVLLLAIVLVAGMGFYANPTDVTTLAVHKKIALEMATQAMEQMKDAGYSSLPNPASGAWETATSVTFSNGSFSFTAQKQRRVTDIEGSSPNIDKKVEIQVTWPESGKQTSQVINLATYMAP